MEKKRFSIDYCQKVFSDWMSMLKTTQKKVIKTDIDSIAMFSCNSQELFQKTTNNENILLSGKATSTRLKFAEQVIENAISEKHSMIILHKANKSLERLVENKNSVIIANSQQKVFDPFTYLTLLEITQLVFETQAAENDFKHNSRYLIQILYEIIACHGSRPYFSNFQNLKFSDITEILNSCMSIGLLNQEQADNLLSLLKMSESECEKVETFFREIATQIEHILAPDPNHTDAVSIISAIKNNKIFCIDIHSAKNTILVELIVNSLLVAKSRGYKFTLFLDDIYIPNREQQNEIFIRSNDHNVIISSSDIYLLVRGRDDIFSDTISEMDKIYIMAHDSQASCERWVAYLCRCDKTPTENCHCLKRNKNTKGEFIIAPEVIYGLPYREMFFTLNNACRLVYVALVTSNSE
jgi:hypothetical protein